MSDRTLLCCPHCGNCVEECFHNDTWVKGVQKTVKQALQIAYDHRQALREKVYVMDARIRRYEQMIKDEK